jgi:cytochrome c biogenesis factor
MVWIDFPAYVTIIFVLLIGGLIDLYISKKQILAKVLISSAFFILVSFIIQLWIQLERPPLRTLGETRLWYGLFLLLIGIITYLRWNYKWFMAYTIFLTSLFLILNLVNPDTYDKTLMPALHSYWFVPHVIVYMIAYALLGATSLVAIKGLYEFHLKGQIEKQTVQLADNLVYLGISFMTLGILFGALWAKEAWGHYWTWDPKETWALLTWFTYLIFLHYRLRHKASSHIALWILVAAFFVLLIAWFGVNYLPSTQNSVHTYSRTS